ncbi:MAG TPA: DUF2628 domain-containing protein [Roseiarcus sp.]|nr:DUF2628 domain-containing protein [Roseiarcus sp.]
MKVFNVHVADRAGFDRAAAAASIHFERQGFSWVAFLFGPFWLIGRGLWRVLVLWLIVAALAIAAVWYGRLTGGAALSLGFVVALYLGFEGPGYASAALHRAGWRLTDVAAGVDRSDAEHNFFSRYGEPAPSSTSRSAGASPPPIPPSQVIGLFPEAGG